MNRKSKSSFIDTDVVLKIGSYRGENLLRKILNSFNYDLYIHDYLIQEELIQGGSALEQLREMIAVDEIKIMCKSDLNPDELQEYESTLHLLANEMQVDLKKSRDHNAGEVRSMAMAFVKDFEYFISDDSGARVAAKKHLQKLNGTYLQTVRMKDIILHIKVHSDELGIDRKMAKQLFLFGTSPKLARTLLEQKKLQLIRDSLKKSFNTNLWPIT